MVIGLNCDHLNFEGMDDLLDLIDDERDSKSKKKEKGEGEPKKKRKRLSDSVNEEDHLTLEEELEMEHDTNENSNDDDEFSLEKLKEKTLKSVRNDLMMLEEDLDENEAVDRQHKPETVQIVNKAPSTQTAFQSSSTPLNLPERYMVWNSIGLITQFMKDGDESIDIEFHNATYHHTIHIKNQFGYTMADMSKEAVVMASPGK